VSRNRKKGWCCSCIVGVSQWGERDGWVATSLVVLVREEEERENNERNEKKNWYEVII